MKNTHTYIHTNVQEYTLKLRLRGSISFPVSFFMCFKVTQIYTYMPNIYIILHTHAHTHTLTHSHTHTHAYTHTHTHTYTCIETDVKIQTGVNNLVFDLIFFTQIYIGRSFSLLNTNVAPNPRLKKIVSFLLHIYIEMQLELTMLRMHTNVAPDPK